MKINKRKKLLQKKTFQAKRKKLSHNKFSHHEILMMDLPPSQKREILNVKSKSKTPILKKLPKLNDNKAFVISLIKEDPRNFKFASEKLKNDLSVALVALELDGLLLEHVGPELKQNKKLTAIAVKNNGLALEFADPKYQDDPEIVAVAMYQNIYSKSFVGPNMKLHFYSQKKKQTIIALRNDGTLLRFADAELRNDFDVVWEAVHQNGLALEFASYRLKADKFIVSEAVKQYSGAIVFASSYLQNDLDIIDLAITNDPTFVKKNTPKNPWKISYLIDKPRPYWN